jgi:hypothetical protein
MQVENRVNLVALGCIMQKRHSQTAR